MAIFLRANPTKWNQYWHSTVKLLDSNAWGVNSVFHSTALIYVFFFVKNNDVMGWSGLVYVKRLWQGDSILDDTVTTYGLTHCGLVMSYGDIDLGQY